ncbi:MAG: Omp28-related outer membrane protein [Chitinophagaceae bacterium]
MKTSSLFLLMISAGLFLSCSKNQDSVIPAELRLEINSSSIYADLMDELVVTVFDNANNNVTDQSRIFIDNNIISGNRFKTAEVKTFTIKAVLNEKETESKKFKATRHTVNNFSKKIIMEEFAGSWCSFCTRFSYLIDTMVRSDNRIIPVQVHSGDLLEFRDVQLMRKKFGTGSFPFGYLNRGQIWDESASMVWELLNKNSKLGLAISSTIYNKTIDARVKVKFDVTTSEKLNVVVLLVEDSLVYPQANFYNYTYDSPFYGMGDPITEYKHNNTLRLAATDIFGDRIPVEFQNKNETWEKNYSFNAASFNLNHCKIVAYVQYTENNVSRWGVLNAQIVKAGSHSGFD